MEEISNDELLLMILKDVFEYVDLIIDCMSEDLLKSVSELMESSASFLKNDNSLEMTLVVNSDNDAFLLIQLLKCLNYAMSIIGRISTEMRSDALKILLESAAKHADE